MSPFQAPKRCKRCNAVIEPPTPTWKDNGACYECCSEEGWQVLGIAGPPPCEHCLNPVLFDQQAIREHGILWHYDCYHAAKDQWCNRCGENQRANGLTVCHECADEMDEHRDELHAAMNQDGK